MHGFIACPSMSVEEVYAGYDLPPSVASIVLDERIGRDEAQGGARADLDKPPLESIVGATRLTFLTVTHPFLFFVFLERNR